MQTTLKRKLACLAVGLLTLTGCQENQSALRPAGLEPATLSAPGTAAVVPADCPPAGLIMRTTEGREFTYLGRDPADPEICVWSTLGSRTISRQIRGLWSETAETGRFHREGLRPLFPLATGKTAAYSTSTSNGFWRFNWRVLGERRITVPAGTFDVWVVEFTEDSITGAFRGERMFYIDKATHSPVRVDSAVLRGNAAYAPSWQAISLTQASRR
jgi:hypothetical protein